MVLYEKLLEIDQLIIHGQYTEALEKIEAGLKTKDISKKDQLSFLAQKGRCVFYFGKFQEALQLANEILSMIQLASNDVSHIDLREC